MVNKIIKTFDNLTPIINIVILKTDDFYKCQKELMDKISITNNSNLDINEKNEKILDYQQDFNKKLDVLSKNNIYNALIDTGATCSTISKNIVSKLNLIPSGISHISTPSDSNIEINKYLISLFLPTNHTQKIDRISNNKGEEQVKISIVPTQMVPYFNLQVIGSPSIHEQNIDAIIGMDIISKSHLTISGNILIISV